MLAFFVVIVAGIIAVHNGDGDAGGTGKGVDDIGGGLGGLLLPLVVATVMFLLVLLVVVAAAVVW